LFVDKLDFPLGEISNVDLKMITFFVLENPAYRQAGKLETRTTPCVVAAFDSVLNINF
jgi:hypothetical protein